MTTGTDDKTATLAKVVGEWYSKDCEERLRAILAEGADPNARVGGKTPLERLGGQGELGALWELLLAAGADPKLPDAEGATPLHTAAHFGNSTPAKLLLDKGVPVDIRDRDGKTPLHRAVSSGYDVDKVVELLIERGAPLDAKDSAGKRAVDVARGELRRKLLERMSGPVAETTKALLAAVGAGEEPQVAELLGRGADPCAVDISADTWGSRDVSGIAAIHLCFTRGIARPVAERVLAHRGIDVNVGAVDGRRPLHVVLDARKGAERRELAAKLLALGADPNVADEDGKTPMYELTSFYTMDGELELIDTLIAAGANTAHTDLSGATVLDTMWEKVQRFHEQHDKAGFLAVMKKLLDANVPCQRRGQVVRWFTSKTEPKQNKEHSAARKRFEQLVQRELAELAGVDCTIELAGERREVALFDWFVLQDEQAADKHAHIDELFEYQIPPSAEAPVDEERWIPFGILGLIGSAETYAELGVEGTLFLDLSEANGDDAPVVVVTQDDDTTIPEKLTYRALIKTVERSD